jgi:hypothetical protein
MKRISRTLVVVLMLLFAGAGTVQADRNGGGHGYSLVDPLVKTIILWV